MKFEIKTAMSHLQNADGSYRGEHCCGCWHFIMDEDAPERPYAKCNECGDVRYGIFPGVENEDAIKPEYIVK